jgi:hypothetical protein
VERTGLKVGLRKFELKDRQMLLNGKRIVFKGVNRHEWSCKTGRTVSREEMLWDVTMAQRSELDYLIYNDPLGYADLILNGDPKEYLKNVTGSHGLED